MHDARDYAVKYFTLFNKKKVLSFGFKKNGQIPFLCFAVGMEGSDTIAGISFFYVQLEQKKLKDKLEKKKIKAGR